MPSDSLNIVVPSLLVYLREPALLSEVGIGRACKRTDQPSGNTGGILVGPSWWEGLGKVSIAQDGTIRGILTGCIWRLPSATGLGR